MRIIGCDLHARQQTVAMLDTATGEAVKLLRLNLASDDKISCMSSSEIADLYSPR